MKQSNVHEFAFFIPSLSSTHKQTAIGSLYTLQDKILIPRITTVLRLSIGETCIFFDRLMHMRVQLATVHKKELVFTIIESHSNTLLKPRVTCIVPLLKKDDLGDAITTITACGVNAIQLVTTAKVQRAWGGAQELERLERLVIASAEQAKWYGLPTLHPPIPLKDALEKERSSFRLFFDPTGKPLRSIITHLYEEQPSSICLIIGPEGDLTHEEKNMLHKNNIPFCALTPTILRAHLAITVATGIIRSL